MPTEKDAKPEIIKPVLFLSHAATDMQLAILLKKAVNQCFPGVTVFATSDPQSLKPTEDWVHSVLDHLRATELVIVIATERSMKRFWVWFEAGASWDRTSRLVTCGIGKTNKGTLPLPFAIYMSFSLTDPKDLDSLFGVIQDRLKVRGSTIDFHALAQRFNEIEDSLVRDQKALEDPYLEQRRKLVSDRLTQMDANGREALKLLLLHGSSSDHFTLTELKTRGFAEAHSNILPGLQVSSNLIQKVPDQPQAQRGMESYETQWEIKPEFRPLLREFFDGRK
jgi:hypothetical protein